MDARTRHALTVSTPSDLEIVMTRSFDAPARLVFEALTDVRHVSRWWGCSEGTDSVFEIDFRVGGEYRFCIRAPSGQEYRQRGIFREIVPPERLVFTFAWDAQGGQRTNEMLIDVTFTELGPERTKMRFVQSAFETASQRDGHLGGWTECFDRLARYLTEARA